MPKPNDPILTACIKDAGLENVKNLTLDHFLSKINGHLDVAHDEYVSKDKEQCDISLDNAIHLLQRAKTFIKRS